MNSSALATLLILGLLPGVMIPIRTMQIANEKFSGESINQGALNKALACYLLLVPGWFVIPKVGYELLTKGCTGEVCSFTLIFLFPVTFLYLVSEVLLYIGRKGL